MVVVVVEVLGNKYIMKLTVNLLYINQNWEEFRLETLIHDKDFLIIDDVSFEKFTGSQGGIELIIDNIYVFYRGCTFYDLGECATFLIKTLVFLGKLDSEKYSDITMDQEEKVEIKDSVNNKLIFSKLETENAVLISYIKGDDDYSWSRNDSFFSNIKIDENIWSDSVFVAVNEFFSLLESLEPKKENSYIYNLLKKWRNDLI